MDNEIKLRISVANKGYYDLEKLFKSKLLFKGSPVVKFPMTFLNIRV